MFGIGGGELLTLLLVAVFLIGPDKLPQFTVDAARFIKKVKALAQSATTELRENLGPGFEDLQVQDLHPKKFISKHLNDAMEEPKEELKDIAEIAKIDPDLL
ncbi:MAG: sec-independent translocase [Actinobacteria bacterium]|jgi:sec-independent protein translocase protein TatB|nr:sec-independent translocase [Actinomycetota bacterium]